MYHQHFYQIVASLTVSICVLCVPRYAFIADVSSLYGVVAIGARLCCALAAAVTNTHIDVKGIY